MEAQSFYTQSLEYFQQIDNIAGIADCLSGFSRIILARNADPHAAQVAARLLGSVEALRESIRWTLSSILYDDYVRHTAAVQACLGEAQFDALCTEGRALSVEQAIQCALNAMDRV